MGFELALALFVVAALAASLAAQARIGRRLPETVARELGERHRAMLVDVSGALAAHAERMHDGMGRLADGLRGAVTRELGATRDRMETLQQAQTESLAHAREAIVEKVHQVLGEQGRAGQELLQSSAQASVERITQVVAELTRTTDQRLEQISGKVSERLDEGFKRTNETFTQVMARLATIDEAQRKIDGLTTNVVSLQQLLGDKRARGALGEMQLEALVADMLPPQSFAMQHTLSTGSRVDCALFLPAPTGTVAIDSKFPLENYHRMCARDASEIERAQATRLFETDVKRHIDAIADKYIVPDETSEGALMFVPAEAVFAEIHGNHPELVAHAMRRRVWIASPTTMMAILTTARAVLKDVETRKQVHVIQESLGKLGKEFERFDERMKKLADHIRLAHKDAEDVCVTSRKISNRFQQIEKVELEDGEILERGRASLSALPAGGGHE
jgi:DNA recombination protein RmuC